MYTCLIMSTQGGLDGLQQDQGKEDGEMGPIDTARTVVNKGTSGIKQYSNAATICGDVHITRICEPRVLENQVGFQPDFGLLSDDKALRYTSKAATLLGKISLH